MSRTRKTLTMSRRSAAIRIEAPGAVVLVRADLRDDEGRPVTSVSVSADGNRYAGEPEQWAHTAHNDTGAHVRVIEGAPRPGCPVAVVDEEAKPGPRVVARFRTIAEAERHIAHEARGNPEKVARGGFGIDAPEEMTNPPPAEPDPALALAEALLAAERGGSRFADYLPHEARAAFERWKAGVMLDIPGEG